jgi:hypothetical protein
VDVAAVVDEVDEEVATGAATVDAVEADTTRTSLEWSGFESMYFTITSSVSYERMTIGVASNAPLV